MTLSGNAGVDTFLGNNGVDTLSGGGGADKLFGNSNDDTLRGDAGNDVLDGGNNNDVLIGGSGNDTLTGGNGDDIFRFNLTTEGIDTIIDFDVSNDTIQFDNASFTTIGSGWHARGRGIRDRCCGRGCWRSCHLQQHYRRALLRLRRYRCDGRNPDCIYGHRIVADQL